MATPSGDLRDLQPEQVLAYDGEARGRHAHSTPALLVSPLLLDSVESDVNPLMRREAERGGEKRREAERSDSSGSMYQESVLRRLGGVHTAVHTDNQLMNRTNSNLPNCPKTLEPHPYNIP